MSTPENIERESRRSDWCRGRAVILCDGSVWWLPPMHPGHMPMLRSLASHLVRIADGSSPLFRDAPDPSALLPLMAEIIAEALLLNYTITAADLHILLIPTNRGEWDHMEAAVAQVVQAAREGRLIGACSHPEMRGFGTQLNQ